MDVSSPPPLTLIVGLSGPSSSGKSTLARLLRSLFTVTLPDRSLKLFILHEDDFYKPDDEIPIKTITSATHGSRELQDWDCADAMNFPLFADTLRHVKAHGRLPEDMFSKEDQNELGAHDVPDQSIEDAQRDVREWFAALDLPSSSSEKQSEETEKGKREVQICLIDGFLLYSDPSASPAIVPREIPELLDAKLFLRATRAQMVERRGNRKGYVTMGDFWVDPPGYVEDVVWENYRREHAWMFEEGNADQGEVVVKRVVDGERIQVASGKGEVKMGELMGWGVGVLKEVVQREV